MIHNQGYNFANIQDRIQAAENLQRAGMNDDARKIMEDLAREILEGAE